MIANAPAIATTIRLAQTDFIEQAGLHNCELAPVGALPTGLQTFQVTRVKQRAGKTGANLLPPITLLDVNVIVTDPHTWPAYYPQEIHIAGSVVQAMEDHTAEHGRHLLLVVREASGAFRLISVDRIKSGRFSAGAYDFPLSAAPTFEEVIESTGLARLMAGAELTPRNKRAGRNPART